ncbi:MAG: sugar phosphate isomerase/epimerase [Leptolyngbya sp. PLA1]|nr:sugar phosphate isomerase/epimerase [Leptolyngbya sp. PLA1]
MRFAFSTVAFPNWTLGRIAGQAKEWGYEGIELRTFGHGSTTLACDPALTAPAKVRGMLAAAGLQPCCLATSARFDDPVTPPVIGHVFDQEREVRAAKSAVDLAVELECPFVRVFGFEIISGESRASALARIGGRLAKVADHCRNSGVRLLVENGGSFARSSDLSELLDRVEASLVGASFCPGVARQAGEEFADAINVLGDRLQVVKLRDFRAGEPCEIGAGDQRCEEDVRALARVGYAGWVVVEHDRMWLRSAADPEKVVRGAAAGVYGWSRGVLRV